MFLRQANDERNYHIFYEMLAGLPSQQKQAFYLQDAETYYYLNQVEWLSASWTPLSSEYCDISGDCVVMVLSVFIQGGDCGIPGKNDTEDFLRLLAAMENLRFTPEDQSVIFRVLSSILHLGNVYFQKHEVEKWKNSNLYFKKMCYYYSTSFDSLFHVAI